jgi:hypothetical protein
MHKMVLATALAAAILVPGSWNSSLVAAHPGHHHQWGDRDYEIVRWSYGDCKIWYDDGGPPVGTGWVVLADGLRSWDAALRELDRLRALRKCA